MKKIPINCSFNLLLSLLCLIKNNQQQLYFPFVLTYFLPFFQSEKKINWPVFHPITLSLQHITSVQLCSCPTFPIIWPLNFNLLLVRAILMMQHVKGPVFSELVPLCISFPNGNRNLQTPRKDGEGLIFHLYSHCQLVTGSRLRWQLQSFA